MNIHDKLSCTLSKWLYHFLQRILWTNVRIKLLVTTCYDHFLHSIKTYLHQMVVISQMQITTVAVHSQKWPKEWASFEGQVERESGTKWRHLFLLLFTNIAIAHYFCRHWALSTVTLKEEGIWALSWSTDFALKSVTVNIDSTYLSVVSSLPSVEQVTLLSPTWFTSLANHYWLQIVLVTGYMWNG